MSTTQSTSPVPTVTLNDGRAIPRLGFGAAFPRLDPREAFPRVGFGAFQITPGETARAVSHALEVGYRHIDTAQMYGNEHEVGEAVRASGLDRAEVFITSKLNNGFHRPADARRAFNQTLTELGVDYVDLFLIHWPLPTLYGGDFVSITEIADRLGRTPSQVVLRWHIQLGHIVFPRSTTPSRIEENFQLFDFELDPGDIDKISGLDKYEEGRIGPHPDRSEPVPD